MKRIFTMLYFWRWSLSHPIDKSRHRKDYEEIADMYGLDKQLVYAFAHGVVPETLMESHIVNELIQRGILR